MRRDPEICEQDWECTPLAVRIVLFSLRQQLRLLEIRCCAYQQEVPTLRAAALQLHNLKLQIAGFEKEFAELRQQVIQVEDLKAEISELRERLGQNSRNSSKPPSSDPPSQTRQPRKGLLSRRERKRGPKAGHQGYGRHLKPESEVDHVIELRPVSCTHCGRLLIGDDPAPARHQVSETVFNITINGLIAIRLKGAGSRLFEYADWAIEWSFLSPENLKAKEIALVQAIGLQRRNVAWRTKD